MGKETKTPANSKELENNRKNGKRWKTQTKFGNIGNMFKPMWKIQTNRTTNKNKNTQTH